jgi:sensor histidine kinase YesM
MSAIKLNKMKIIQHVAAWIIFVIIQFIQYNAFNPLSESFSNNSKYIAFFFSNTLLILFYYLSYGLFVCFYISLFFLLFVIFPDYIIISEKVAHNPLLFLIIFILIRLLLIFFVSFIFYNQKRKIEEEKNNFKNEIYSLRSQINPHFLFNTLNNIYALSLNY